MRRLVEAMVWTVAALLISRTWLVQGGLIPCRAHGGSMMPAIRGIHAVSRCPDCAEQFAVDCSDSLPARLVCPNCDAVQGVDSLSPPALGDGLLVARSAFALRAPRRWEPAAFRLPFSPDHIAIKRVVGLPGEEVQIKNGELFIDGHLARKPYPVARAMAILVYDADHPPGDARLPPRWRSAERGSRWVEAAGRFARRATAANEPFDWLVYRHWRRIASAEGSVEPQPIRDDCYNHTTNRREEDSHTVRDLILSFRLVEVFGKGTLAARIEGGGATLEVHLDPHQRRFSAKFNGSEVPGASGRLPCELANTELWFAQCDGQLIFACDDHPLIQWPFDHPRDSGEASVAIGARGLGVVLDRLRLFRDVYYLGPIRADGQVRFDRPCRLGADEYFVLGDNSLVSLDSRNWPSSPGVPRNLLVGKPFVVLYPMRVARVGPWYFHVPDFERIRYIPW